MTDDLLAWDARPFDSAHAAGDDDIDWGDDGDDGGGIDWGDDGDDDSGGIDWGDDGDDGDDDSGGIDWGDDGGTEEKAADDGGGIDWGDEPVASEPVPAPAEPAPAEPAPAEPAPAEPEPAPEPVAATPEPAAAWEAPSLRDAIANLEFADDAYHFVFAADEDNAVLYVQEAPLPGDAFTAAMAAVPGASVVSGKVRWDEDDDVAVFDAGGAALQAALTGPLAAEVPVLADAKVDGVAAEAEAASAAPAGFEDLVRADATCGSLLARLEAAGPKATDAQERIDKAMAALVDQAGLIANLAKAAGERPDASKANDAKSMTEALPVMRQGVAEAQERGGKVLGKVEKIKQQLRDALDAADGELAEAWATAKTNPPSYLKPAGQAAGLEAPSGDFRAAVDELYKVMGDLAKGMGQLKMNGKSRAVAEFAPRGVPLGLAETINGHVAADLEGTRGPIDSLANQILTALKNSLDTQRQLKQWEEWKSNFPPDKAERVTKNVAELADLIADQIAALALVRGGVRE